MFNISNSSNYIILLTQHPNQNPLRRLIKAHRKNYKAAPPHFHITHIKSTRNLDKFSVYFPLNTTSLLIPLSNKGSLPFKNVIANIIFG